MRSDSAGCVTASRAACGADASEARGPEERLELRERDLQRGMPAVTGSRRAP
jgi:hypothetical protein